MNRLSFILSVCIVCHVLTGCALKSPTARPARAAAGTPVADKFAGVRWVDARQLTLEGQGWTATASPYDRLPTRAGELVTPAVWNLSTHAAGLCVRFATNSGKIYGTWDSGGAMYHMPSTGMSGLDVYAKNESGAWEFISIGRPHPDKPQYTRKQIATAPREGLVEYMVFLPLYSNVDTVEIGFEQGATVRKGFARSEDAKPVVFYGTSITQGGCASRSGMSHPAILSRWLDREIINLGFSGAGKMEMVMADLLGELDASLYVLECLPNMTDEMVDERVAPFVRRLRNHQPETPILLIDHCVFDASHKRNIRYREIYEELKSSGVQYLHHLPNNGLLSGRENGTVDGVHPTDLGFERMAAYQEPVIRGLLKNYGN